MEIKYRKPRISLETKLKALTDYNGSMSVADVLKKYNMSRGTFYDFLKKEAKREV